MVSAEAIELANRLEQVISEQDLRTMRVLRIFRAFWKHWEWLCGSIWIYKFYNHHPFSKDTIFLANSKGEEYWNRSDDVGWAYDQTIILRDMFPLCFLIESTVWFSWTSLSYRVLKHCGMMRRIDDVNFNFMDHLWEFEEDWSRCANQPVGIPSIALGNIWIYIYIRI